MDLLAGLRDALGPSRLITDAEVKGLHERDWTGRWGGPCLAVARPGSTEEVAAVIDLCRAAGVAVVPQGGNTGLVGGGVPAGSGPPPVVVSTRRLDRIGRFDTAAMQVTAGAGTTIGDLRRAAAAGGAGFAVDLASRDSATVGGAVATNAGGLYAFGDGPMRAQVVGLEAVMADGSVVSRLSGLVRDNTGYDLSQLLVGSEGTLGLVTAARLRLVPPRPERAVALLGVASTSAAVDALAALRSRCGDLVAAEVMYRSGLELVCGYAGLADPLPAPWAAYLLVEAAGAADPTDRLLAGMGASGVDGNATAVATAEAARRRLWAYRERHTDAVASVGVAHKLDVALPLARLAGFERDVRAAVAAMAPAARVFMWGHVGDGNLHVNVVGPPAGDEAVDEAVLTLAAGMGGSISAEHGIGRAKNRWLALARTPAELLAQRALKDALDPGGLLNPGVLTPAG